MFAGGGILLFASRRMYFGIEVDDYAHVQSAAMR